MKYISKFKNAINYNTAYNERIYKYLLKVFYERTNKKEYKSQILIHNIRYSNVIIIKNAILTMKLQDERVKKNN